MNDVLYQLAIVFRERMGIDACRRPGCVAVVFFFWDLNFALLAPEVVCSRPKLFRLFFTRARNRLISAKSADFKTKSTDFVSKFPDFEPKSTDFGPKSADFGPKSVDFGSKSIDFGRKSVDFGPKSVDFGRKSLDFGTVKKSLEGSVQGWMEA